jgi:pimeloyl-ACP methyl ester carboxylesterase
MPGQAFDVAGHRLHLECTGRGAPTVVLENGLGESSPMWARVVAATSPTTRVCAYDRAGQGWSDAATGPRDSIAVAADLHRLLEVAGEHGPYVLVGHSVGGVYAMTYAARYPEQVAGMVLLDSTSPRQFTEMKDYPSQYAMLRRLYGVAPTLARVGIGHLVPGLSASELPRPAGKQAGAFAVSPRTWRTARDELSGFPRAFEQAQALTMLGDKPLVVVSASQTLANTPGWAHAQAELASLSTQSITRTVLSSHTGLLEDEQAAGQSATAVTSVARAVRTRSLP